jgi:hypothetical protein
VTWTRAAAIFRRITRAEIKRFEDALAHAGEEQPALREGKVKSRVLTSLLDLPNVLIEGRVVSRLTQKELARRLGVSEQQVQRYEKTRYAGVGIERLQEVADAAHSTDR